MKKANQTDREKMTDRVYAAMETGNHGNARTLLVEYKELFPAAACALHADIVRTYGVSL